MKLGELRHLALKAPSGPYRQNLCHAPLYPPNDKYYRLAIPFPEGQSETYVGCGFAKKGEDLSAYFAALSPDVVLNLIGVLVKAREKLDSIYQSMEACVGKLQDRGSQRFLLGEMDSVHRFLTELKGME